MSHSPQKTSRASVAVLQTKSSDAGHEHPTVRSIHNADVALLFDRLADLLEIQNANPFRIRAYRNASRLIGAQPRSVSDMLDEGADLSELPGIGKDLAAKIREIVETGHLALLDETEKSVPRELVELLLLPGLGPKRVQRLHEELAIDTIAELKRAAEAGKIANLRGFSAQFER
jgi:DNA polymerase (family 10)